MREFTHSCICDLLYVIRYDLKLKGCLAELPKQEIFSLPNYKTTTKETVYLSPEIIRGTTIIISLCFKRCP